jgi:hypothetical protein
VRYISMNRVRSCTGPVTSQGITHPPFRRISVTHVPGLFCHLCARSVPTLKLPRPGFGSAAEPPTSSPARRRHAGCGMPVVSTQLLGGNRRAALASARGPRPRSLACDPLGARKRVLCMRTRIRTGGQANPRYRRGQRSLRRPPPWPERCVEKSRTGCLMTRSRVIGYSQFSTAAPASNDRCVADPRCFLRWLRWPGSWQRLRITHA